jgi:hypothetical protein
VLVDLGAEYVTWTAAYDGTRWSCTNGHYFLKDRLVGAAKDLEDRAAPA